MVIFLTACARSGRSPMVLWKRMMVSFACGSKRWYTHLCARSRNSLHVLVTASRSHLDLGDIMPEHLVNKAPGSTAGPGRQWGHRCSRMHNQSSCGSPPVQFGLRVSLSVPVSASSNVSSAVFGIGLDSVRAGDSISDLATGWSNVISTE